MKMRTTLRICYATWWSFIRADQSLLKRLTFLLWLMLCRCCIAGGSASDLSFNSQLFASVVLQKDMTGHFVKGMTVGRCQVGKGCDGYGGWWLGSCQTLRWMIVQSQHRNVCIRHASAQSRIKKPLLLNKPLAIIISFVFWLIANVPCIEDACMILSVYAEKVRYLAVWIITGWRWYIVRRRNRWHISVRACGVKWKICLLRCSSRWTALPSVICATPEISYWNSSLFLLLVMMVSCCFHFNLFENKPQTNVVSCQQRQRKQC